MPDKPMRAAGVAELLRMGYTAQQVAEALSRADKGDVSGALDVIFPPRRVTDSGSDGRGSDIPSSESGA